MSDVERYEDRGYQNPRSPGTGSGVLLVLLGLWGALIPFIGPYFNFTFGPNVPWTWTPARGWLEVLPGVVTVVGGLLLVTARTRTGARFGAWLAVLAGAWFVVGRIFATPWGIGDPGAPVPSGQGSLAALELTSFTGLGALIIALAGVTLGRLMVRPRPLDEYHRDDYVAPADAEPVAHERVNVEHVEPDPNQPVGTQPLGTRPRWRDSFRGPGHRPLPH